MKELINEHIKFWIWENIQKKKQLHIFTQKKKKIHMNSFHYFCWRQNFVHFDFNFWRCKTLQTHYIFRDFLVNSKDFLIFYYMISINKSYCSGNSKKMYKQTEKENISPFDQIQLPFASKQANKYLYNLSK